MSQTAFAVGLTPMAAATATASAMPVARQPSRAAAARPEFDEDVHTRARKAGKAAYDRVIATGQNRLKDEELNHAVSTVGANLLATLGKPAPEELTPNFQGENVNYAYQISIASNLRHKPTNTMYVRNLYSADAPHPLVATSLLSEPDSEGVAELFFGLSASGISDSDKLKYVQAEVVRIVRDIFMYTLHFSFGHYEEAQPIRIMVDSNAKALVYMAFWMEGFETPDRVSKAWEMTREDGEKVDVNLGDLVDKIQKNRDSKKEWNAGLTDEESRAYTKRLEDLNNENMVPVGEVQRKFTSEEIGYFDLPRMFIDASRFARAYDRLNAMQMKICMSLPPAHVNELAIRYMDPEILAQAPASFMTRRLDNNGEVLMGGEIMMTFFKSLVLEYLRPGSTPIQPAVTIPKDVPIVSRPAPAAAPSAQDADSDDEDLNALLGK